MEYSPRGLKIFEHSVDKLFDISPEGANTKASAIQSQERPHRLREVILGRHLRIIDKHWNEWYA
jgi:hypothetical protein